MGQRSSTARRRSLSVVQRTRYFRFAELILCLLCLLLAIFFWTSVHALTITTVVIFATSLSFFIITLTDVMAGMTRNQYPIAAWVAIAFLAAFMFFLSFGFLIFRANFLIGIIAFLITAIVFLLDGIMILCHLYKSEFSKRVHPVIEQKEEKVEEIVTEEVVQTDRSEPVNESPVQVRTYAARGSSQPRRSFPTTTYGGTFHVGGKDEPPLPTPDNLTGMERKRSSQMYANRKCTRDDRPRTMQDVFTQKPSVAEESPLYPTLVEEVVERKSYATVESTRPKQSEVYDPSETSSSFQEVQSTVKSRNQECGVCGTGEKMTVCRREEDVQTETNWSYHPEDMQSRTARPSQAAGEPLIQQPLGVFTMGSRPQDYHQKNCPSPMCTCCNRDLSTRDQASTVVRGAVRQYPQDTVHEQQKMIQDQLEQTRQVYEPHVCGCHEEPLAETDQPQNLKDPPAKDWKEDDGTSMTMPDGSVVSNVSLYGSERLRKLSILQKEPKNSASATSYGDDQFIFDDDVLSELSVSPDSGKRVTIADFPTSSSQGSTAQEYESWVRNMMQNESIMNKEDQDRKASTEKPTGSQEDLVETFESKRVNNKRPSEDGSMYHPDRTPTVIKLSKQLQQPLLNKNTADHSKKKSVSPSTKKEILQKDDKTIVTQRTEMADGSPPRKRKAVPCVKRCWETPKKESMSLYTYEGPAEEKKYLGNVQTWGTEITTTTTVRTTHFGNVDTDPENVTERSMESTYTSSKSPPPVYSSPERRSHVSNEVFKRTEATVLRNSIMDRNKMKEQTLDDNRCLVPCCELPPFEIDVVHEVEDPNADELSETEEIRKEVNTSLAARNPADEVELMKKRRSILKNRREIDQEIRDELTVENGDGSNEQLGNLLMRTRSSIEYRKPEEIKPPNTRKNTIERIEEYVETDGAENVTSVSKKLQKSHVKETEKKIVVKSTCGCICKCLCRNTQMSAVKDKQRIRNKSFDIDKYYVTSLSELPYHPRDDYKLDSKTLVDAMDRRVSDLSDQQMTEMETYFWKNPYQSGRPSRVPETFASARWSTQSETNAKEEMQDENTEEASSVSKRGSVKRSHDSP